jgi:hypothetical protein
MFFGYKAYIPAGFEPGSSDPRPLRYVLWSLWVYGLRGNQGMG